MRRAVRRLLTAAQGLDPLNCLTAHIAYVPQIQLRSECTCACVRHATETASLFLY